MRRSGDLTFGPQALAGARVHTLRRCAQRRRGRARLCAFFLGAVVVTMVVAGCGPIGYMQQVHRRAADAVEDARRAGAETAAPYEFTSAVAYLDKAREEGAEAEYGNAIELGRRAEELALQARALARRQAAARSPAAGTAGGAGEPPPPSRGPAP